MLTIVIITVIGFLLLLALLFNGLLQFRKAKETARRFECEKYSAALKTTLDLIKLTGYLPYRSQAIQLCLYKKLESTAQSILYIDKTNKRAKEISASAQHHIEQLSSYIPTVEDDENLWQLPGTEKQSLAFLRFIKRLKATLKAEFAKGNINYDDFLVELKKLESLRIRISIKNLKNRLELALSNKDVEMAIQILEKGIQFLSSRDDDYSVKELHKFEEQHRRAKEKLAYRQRHSPAERNKNRVRERDKEIQQIFDQDKKKVGW